MRFTTTQLIITKPTRHNVRASNTEIVLTGFVNNLKE